MISKKYVRETTGKTIAYVIEDDGKKYNLGEYLGVALGTQKFICTLFNLCRGEK